MLARNWGSQHARATPAELLPLALLHPAAAGGAAVVAMWVSGSCCWGGKKKRGRALGSLLRKVAVVLAEPLRRLRLALPLALL